jgi:hypothetical protein
LSVGFVDDPYQGLESDGIITFVVQVLGTLERDLLVQFSTEDLAIPQAIGKYRIPCYLLRATV